MARDDRPLILHLRATNFVGGPEKQILEHLRRMQDGPCGAALCTYDENGKPSSLHEAGMDMGLTCHRLPTHGCAGSAGVRALAALLGRLETAVLVTHGYKPDILGRLASWQAGVPMLAVSRGWTGENWKVRCYEALDRIALRFADRVVAVSDGQRAKLLRAGVAPHKIRVSHNAISLEQQKGPDADPSERERLGIPPDALLVGTAGRLSPEKNHLGLVRAAAQVLRQRSDVHFVIWGEGPLRRQLEQEIEAQNLRGRIHLPGFRADVQRHFHEIDLFVLPSHTEGLSNVLLEAAACSKAVVATAVGGNPEVVLDGTTGILTPAGDAVALAEAILRLLAAPELRTAMGRTGRRRVAEHFDFDAQTDRYLALYRSLLSGERQTA